jgi:hypothetical protein
MSYKTDVELQAAVDAQIIVNGNREITPVIDAAIRTNFIDSKINKALTSAQIFVGNASNMAAAVAMSGEATISNAGVVTLANSAVIGKVLIGYTSGAGTVSATDTILQGIQKLNGNAVATDLLVVHLAGTESITGAKTFNVNASFNADIIFNNDETGFVFNSGGGEIKEVAGVMTFSAGNGIAMVLGGDPFSIGGASTVDIVNSGATTINPATTLNLGSATTTAVVIGSGATTVTINGNNLTDELGYLNGVTSGIQTQIDGKQASDADLTSWAGVTRASGFDTFVATPSSANFKSLITDETGSGGVVVFSTAPTLTGSVTIDTSGTLTVASDTDVTTTLGRGKIFSAVSDFAYFAHFDSATSTNYALVQSAAGTTTALNAATGGNVILRINNTNKLTMSTSLLTFADALDMAFNTGTGTKIGTATGQKLSFWNKAPIIQPTTGITGATLVSNGGTTITSTDTFGGYTLQQLAAIIINTGLAA